MMNDFMQTEYFFPILTITMVIYGVYNILKIIFNLKETLTEIIVVMIITMIILLIYGKVKEW